MDYLENIELSNLEMRYDGFSFAKYYVDDILYTGYYKLCEEQLGDIDIIMIGYARNGILIGMTKRFVTKTKVDYYNVGDLYAVGTQSDGVSHGFILTKFSFGFTDYNHRITSLSCRDKGFRTSYYSIFDDKNWCYNEWQEMRENNFIEKFYDNDLDFLPYYNLQNEMREKVIKEDRLPSAIKYIAGVDVAYHEVSQKMVGGIVVLDAETLEVVETALHEMEISFPYIPGLFSFREIPPLLEAYKKLNIKPDLIVCDAHGIAHPMGVGMATHLGIELDIPTIGCAKKRLVGYYDKEALGTQRGDSQSLIWDSQEVGKALRTQDNIKPMFVSIGHKISLETTCEWVLKLCPNYRLPETTRAVDHLVNQVLKERTDFNLFPEDDNEEAF